MEIVAQRGRGRTQNSQPLNKSLVCFLDDSGNKIGFQWMFLEE